jgi:hypothetical protein
MTVHAIAPASSALDPTIVEEVLLGGDLSKLTPTQRTAYYTRVCETLGLNPLTQPFAYLRLNGKEVLYAKRDATEQLRKLHGVSITEMTTQRFNEIYIVTVKAVDKTGRTDMSTGAVPLGTLRGEALANALLKAETKAKRRVTLSICGLGLLDESEIETIRQEAEPVTIHGETINPQTGEILPPAQAAIDAGHADMLVISAAQRRRLWVVARASGWKDEELKRWLLATYQVHSTSAIRRVQYDSIIEAIQRGTEGHV